MKIWGKDKSKLQKYIFEIRGSTTRSWVLTTITKYLLTPNWALRGKALRWRKSLKCTTPSQKKFTFGERTIRRNLICFFSKMEKASVTNSRFQTPLV